MILSARWMIVFLVVIMLLSFVAVLGARVFVHETMGESAVAEVSHYPVKMLMILNQTAFRIEDRVNITFYLENIGNETLELSFMDGREHFSFTVYDENGLKVYEPQSAFLQERIPMNLPPGFATGITGGLFWYQEYTPVFKGFDQDPMYEYRKTPPGIYKIVGSFTSVSLHLAMETPPITITTE